jgi:hypothetical protein
MLVLWLLLTENTGPDTMFLPTKCVEVSGDREHLSDPGLCIKNPSRLSLRLVISVTMSHKSLEFARVRMSST